MTLRRISMSRSSPGLHRTVFLLFICAFILPARARLAFAVFDIQLVRLADSNHPNVGDLTEEFTSDPANAIQFSDPNGTMLAPMLHNAAAIWEEIFQFNDHTIEITWLWDNDLALIDGMGNQPTISAQASRLVDQDDDGRVDFAVIQFNTNRTDWWFDPTPGGDSEFDLEQQLFRGIVSPPSQDPAERFPVGAGQPHVLMETAYTGRAPSTSPANGLRDTVTVAMHEMGHALGMGSSHDPLMSEVDNDLIFDLDASKTGGVQVQAYARGHPANLDGIGNTNGPTSHLAGFEALMGSNGNDRRKYPSALDIIALSLVSGFDEVWLPRTDFLTGNSWNTSGNWEGDRTPSTSVDAFVRHGGTVTLSGFGAAGNLLVDEGSLVSTQTNTLFVQQVTTVGGTPGDTSQITINTGGELDSDELRIGFDGRVLLVADSSLLQAELVEIQSGGTLEGRGTVDLNDAVLGRLHSVGRIRVTSGELVIDSPNSLGLDLEGGIVEAIDGNLRFETGMATAMGADLTVGAGRQVAFNAGGTIGAGGLLNLVGTANNPARSTGSTLFVGLNGVVNGSGVGIVENALVLLPSSALTTQFGDPSSVLRLNGSTFFQGGTAVGSGTIQQNGDAFVDADTVINVNTYDMDGASGATTITIGAGHTLEINSPNIDNTGNNDFDGTIDVNGGTLDMDPDWILDGTLNLTEVGTTAVLTGPGTMTVSTVGQINVSGSGRIDSDVVLAGGLFVGSDATFNGEVLVTAAANLETDGPGDVIDFNGPTTLGGGSYVGNGLIQFDGDVSVNGNTSIGMADADLDGDLANGSISIAPNVTFSVASATLDPGDDAYDAVMNVRGTFSSIVPFQLDGTLNLIEVGGQPIPRINGLTGFTVRSSGVVNTDGDAQINRSTLVQGDLNVGVGTTEINGATIEFAASADVVVASGGVLELNGETTFLGGDYTGAGLIQFNGQTDVDANTTIHTARVDLDGALENTSININNAALTLNVNRLDVNNSIVGGAITAVGQNARLTVNLDNPLSAWRQSSTGVLTLTNPTPAAGAVTMLSGSDVSAEGVINASGPLSLDVNITVRNRLNTATSTTNVHFAGDDRSYIYANPMATIAGSGGVTVDHGTTLNLEGESVIQAVFTNAGRLEIGFAASEVAIDVMVAASSLIRGPFAQTSVGELAVDLGGLAQSTEYDLLEVIGPARLNGIIEAMLIDGFVPKIGDVFQVLTATGGVIGKFDDVEVIDEQDVLAFALTDIYSNNDVQLRVDDVFLIGDYNDNGTVDAADYALWRDNAGAPPGTLPNDVDGGLIGKAQYDTWKTHFGNTFPKSSAFSVPEPASLCLLILVALLTASRGRDFGMLRA